MLLNFYIYFIIIVFFKKYIKFHIQKKKALIFYNNTLLIQFQ